MGSDLSWYIPLLVLLGMAVAFAGFTLFASYFLGPRKDSKEKGEAYECGVSPVGDARDRFPVKFYLVAMLFIVFDLEAVFMYPWAVIYRRFSPTMFGFVEMLIFIFVLLIGYIYVIRKKALEWD
jgi:NADH-quinone oxidoreductase subunit A